MFINCKLLFSAVLLLSLVVPVFSFEPSGFLNDEHTLALWDFNDKAGANRFEDTSGNGRTLIGMNGATGVGGEGVGNLEIRPDVSVTTTWGQIKSESF